MACIPTVGFFVLAPFMIFAWAPSPWGEPAFLSKDALPIPTLINPPPSQGSSLNQQDYEKLLRYQTTRTDSECRRANAESPATFDAFFGAEQGLLTPSEVEKWAPFFAQLRSDVGFFSFQVKDVWKRPRPYVTDPRIEPCIPKEASSAYPSAHTAVARVFGLVLSKLDPSRRDAFMRTADRIAEDRILGGVHHPTDVEAGKKLGDVVYAALMKSPAFLAALEQQQFTH